MPLTPSEQDYAESLLVSAQFGDTAQSASAKAALDAWTRQSGERQAYVRKLEAADHSLDKNLSDLKARYARHVEPASAQRIAPARAIRWHRSPAAYLLAAGLAASVLWAVNPVLSRQEASSEIGQQRMIDLDDGSEVLLNTNTAGRFVNRLRSREWTLERGEALFSVKHSPWRPFHVFAESVDIRDIGTRFSVRRLAGGVSVAVLEGSVEVSAAGNKAPALLGPNEAIRTDGSVFTSLDPKSFDTLVSWKDRRLDFNGTSLTDVVSELQRYRSEPIVLADARAAKVQITGGFSSADPDHLLDMLPLVAPVAVSRKQDGTVVISSRR
ncbi:FecR family protein [Cupriavidus sp. 30B13]|uniref:FecR family protein n=1 Tax=Cupriavidus sp. 30B13 TaxID=3384241 RepID=UPI003B90C327